MIWQCSPNYCERLNSKQSEVVANILVTVKNLFPSFWRLLVADDLHNIWCTALYHIKFCIIFCSKEQLLLTISMLTFRFWLQHGQAAYTIHFRDSHSRKSGAVKSGECYGQVSCQIVNKLCWKYLQSYVVAIYVGLKNNTAGMMCSYIYNLNLYKISNAQQSSQSLVPNLDLKKNCVQP